MAKPLLLIYISFCMYLTMYLTFFNDGLTVYVNLEIGASGCFWIGLVLPPLVYTTLFIDFYYRSFHYRSWLLGHVSLFLSSIIIFFYY